MSSVESLAMSSFSCKHKIPLEFRTWSLRSDALYLGLEVRSNVVPRRRWFHTQPRINRNPHPYSSKNVKITKFFEIWSILRMRNDIGHLEAGHSTSKDGPRLHPQAREQHVILKFVAFSTIWAWFSTKLRPLSTNTSSISHENVIWTSKWETLSLSRYILKFAY